MAVRADLNGIKTQVQTILLAANTTTGSPIDLSADLADSVRVREILKIHPELIVPQASFFPLVTCYISDKSQKRDDIASTQLAAKRRSTITMDVVGSVWNNNFKVDDEDPADEDINHLMENIELILRSNPTLNGKVTWQKPTSCRYYTTILDEQTHLRSGILRYECEIFY